MAVFTATPGDCYQMHHDFEDIEVKQTPPALLEKRCKEAEEMHGAHGAMCDPYIHLEETLQYTRRCLK